ncbi:MAG TPA: YfhO family protein [Solirubrobacteraceae bacterium]|nr:YfhO family protein [Solirubrobacteraceae bacterium]
MAGRWSSFAALALAFVVYYWPVLIGTHLVDGSQLVFNTYLPWALAPPQGLEHVNSALKDSVVSLAPAMTFVRESLASGQLPLWNPYTEFGFPFFEQSQWGILSPVQLPFLAPPSLYGIETAQTLAGMLKIAVAGSGCYLLSRRLACTRPAAVFAALAFMFGGYVTVWLSMPASSTAVVLPWAFLALELVLAGARPWLGAAGLALAIGAVVAGGHPEVVLFAILGLAIYGAVRALQLRAQLRSQLRLRAGALTVGVLLAIGLSAVILLPAQELLGRSIDSAARTRQYHDYYLPWRTLSFIYAPDHSGSPIRGQPELGTFYSAFHAPWYVGLVALLGVGAALVARDRRLLPFATIAAATVTICMNLWPWRQIEALVPRLGGVYKPNSLVIWSLALALAGGVGVDRLQRALGRHTRRPAIGAAVAAALCVALFVELYSWGHQFNPRVAKAHVGVPLVAGLRALPAGAGAPRTAFLGHTTRPLLAMGFDRSDVRSYGQPTRRDYDAFMGTVITDYAGAYATDVAYAIGSLRPNALRVLRAAGARYAAYSDGHWRLPGYRSTVAGTVNVFDAGPGVTRARLVSGFEALAGETATLRRVADPRFDPAREVVLDRSPPGLRPSPGTRPPGAPPVITRYRNDRVDLTATLSRPGILVLADSSYPGWSARVDGHSAHIYRADGLFRGLALPVGSHRISFNYRPTSVIVGAIVSLLSLVAVAGLGWWGRRRAPRPLSGHGEHL